jgi:seryl-tRNA synthetase
MIDKLYIQESYRIIQEYDILINEIIQIETKMLSLKSSLKRRKDELDDLLSKEREMNKSEKYKALNDILEKYDNEMDDIQKTLDPHLQRMEKLKKDSVQLHTLLIDKYPEYSEEELKQHVLEGIEKYKKELN